MVAPLGGQALAESVSDVVAQVNQGNYQHYLDDLLYTHDGDNRGLGGADHDAARDNIFNLFDGFGLAPELDPFSYSGNTYYNVVATRRGAVYPNQIYIVGAHYDSISGDPANRPGADDNASGVAGVLEAARVLSSYSFESTLVFIAFDREEQGLIGSWAYSNAHAADNILGMVSMDMIAYNPVGEHHDKVSIYGRTTSDPIKQDLAQAVTNYGGGILPEIGGDRPYSDHAPFEANGFEACLLIEQAMDTNANPNYHKPTDSVDTPGYIDYQYATNMTRSVVGYLTASAQLVPEPAPATLLGSGVLVAVFLIVGRRRGRL
jgi:Zn-dependent M28 family amino/carboxypeptidase